MGGAVNPDWNTPPNGDFARYVEQLAVRAGQPSGRIGQERGLDAGAPSPGQQLASAAPRPKPPAGASAKGRPAGQSPATALKALMAIGVVGGLIFTWLWVIGGPFALVFGAIAVVWLFGKGRFKTLRESLDQADWRQALQEAARKQKERQRKQQGQ
jgi:hypothetical protein